MCTVTFLPRRRGYALAMNRDEQRTRIAAMPPAETSVAGRTVLAPSEPGGGTWLALNDAGVTFALINWYEVKARVPARAVSRGQVVRAVGALDSPASASRRLQVLPLRKTNPFRLVGIFPAARKIAEWRWDLKKLVRFNLPWQARQWISSGFDEPMARRVRSQTFRQARRQKSVGSLVWLRRLHRSHAPQTGPFAICMHRDEAATVSYTEVVITPKEASLRYHAGAPCQRGADFIHRLERWS